MATIGEVFNQKMNETFLIKSKTKLKKKKTGSCLIDFDVVFPIQSSEFIKLLNFGSHQKMFLKFAAPT